VRWSEDGAGDTRTIINRAGVRRVADDGASSFYILAEVWRREVLRGFDVAAVNRALLNSGLLERDGDGKASIVVRLPTIGLTRCYHVLSAILGGGR
jgi:uncharacterized protein (DUF927 family)